MEELNIEMSFMFDFTPAEPIYLFIIYIKLEARIIVSTLFFCHINKYVGSLLDRCPPIPQALAVNIEKLLQAGKTCIALSDFMCLSHHTHRCEFLA